VPWPPDYVVESQNNHADAKREHGEVLVGNAQKCNLCVDVKKFRDHPKRVGTYPKCDGQIMAKLRHELPGTPRNNNRNDECWNNHNDAK